MLFLRRTLPLAIAFTVGIVGISIYYIPHSAAQGVEETLSLWLRIVYAFAFFLGAFAQTGPAPALRHGPEAL